MLSNTIHRVIHAGQREMRERLFALINMTVCVSVICLLHPNAEAEEDLSSFITYLEKQGQPTLEEITDKVPAAESAAGQFMVWKYDVVLASVEKRVKPLVELYPAGTLTLEPRSVLERYRGERRISFFTQFSAPALLVNPRKLSLPAVRLYKLTVNFDGRTIYGLRVAAPLQQDYASDCEIYQRAFRYIADLNARIVGFTHGRIIEQLSHNIGPSQFFDYNGPHEWSEHKRNGQTDQFTRALELTNYAHSTGDRYVMSDHPDFSVDAVDPANEVFITVFLWREPLLNKFLARLKPLPERIPDFIMQIAAEPCPAKDHR